MSRRKNPRGISLNGMLLLDKPEGFSSNQALQKTKGLMDARKAGHTGSLDPIATGLLPLCFGETTKISSLFLTADKTYTVLIRLGVTTETGDREGQVVEQKPVAFTTELLTEVLERYRGSYDQMPPMYSALKKNGQPLYKLARQGIVVERVPRPVTVYNLTMDNYKDDVLELTVSCSRGFYIRTLAEEIGRDLGCGGHVEVLRRTHLGAFSLDQTITMPQLEAIVNSEERQKLLLPTHQSLAHLPKVNIPENLAGYLKLGRTVRTNNATVSGLVRIYGEGSGFLGLGEIDTDQKLSPKRIFQS